MYFKESVLPLSIVHEYRIASRTQVIYIAVILSVVIGLASLPFVEIPISVRATGVLQPEADRVDLVPPVGGKITNVMITNNQKVHTGDTLLTLDASLIRHRVTLMGERAGRLTQFIKDIRTVVSYADKISAGEAKIPLLTDKYTSAWNQFLQEMSEKRIIKEQSERTFTRHNYLYYAKNITLSEFERAKFEFDQATSSYLLLIKRYKFQWEAEAVEYIKELKELDAERSEANGQHDLYTIISPFSGSIQNLKPLEKGEYVFSGQKIAELSPDGVFKAYCYVRPSEIAMIKVGQQVRFSRDDFFYYKSGHLSGKVSEVPDDIILLNNTVPVYRIECTLDKEHLQQNSRAYLKKGMGVTARFSIGCYSLFQLLVKSAGELVDPEFNERN